MRRELHADCVRPYDPRMNSYTPLITASAKFHPVGQGCFYTCTVSPSNGGPEFRFFYDCGTASAKSHLEGCIEDYRKSFTDPYDVQVDAGIISHFDADHVNGLDLLLGEGVSVNTVFLPYLVPLHRIALATRHPDEGAAYYDFLEDPVEFLLDRGVRQIVFVGSGPEGSFDEAPFDEVGNVPPPGASGSDRPPFSLDKMEPLREPPSEFVAEQDRRRASNSASAAAVSFKDHRQKLPCGFGWQFKFFNYKVSDGKGLGSAERWESFRREVRRCAGTLNPDRILPRLKDAAFRKELISCYRHICYDHNNVSLALWHGPAQRVRGTFAITGGDSPHRYWPHRFHDEIPIEARQSGNGGTLLTGDISLKTNLRQFAQHFSERLSRVNLVQLPHHGSRHSWNSELLSHLDGRTWFAVNAGTANRFGHPHNEVFFDLRGYHAVIGTETSSVDTRITVGI